MAPTSRLVDSRRPRSVPAPPPPLERRRSCLISARWRVHVPRRGEVIADTATAGADLELFSQNYRPAREPERDVGGRLALTFWIDRGTQDEPQREALAAFVQNPALDLGAMMVKAQTAVFELAEIGDAISLLVSDGKPRLSLTQVRRAPGERPAWWCRSCIHELLGLAGGQYRLEEVRLDLPLVSIVAASMIRAREAG